MFPYMSRNVDGLRVATCVFEAACFHKSVRVACRCGHEAFFQAHGLWWLFTQRRWSDEFRDMRERFFCIRCWTVQRTRERPRVIEASRKPVTYNLPMPDEREWKRALRRFRS